MTEKQILQVFIAALWKEYELQKLVGILILLAVTTVFIFTFAEFVAPEVMNDSQSGILPPGLAQNPLLASQKLAYLFGSISLILLALVSFVVAVFVSKWARVYGKSQTQLREAIDNGSLIKFIKNHH